MPYKATPHTVSASINGKLREATRLLPASAMCLADNWAEEGYIDIQITDQFGVAYSPENFRARLPIRKLIIRRQRGALAP